MSKNEVWYIHPNVLLRLVSFVNFLLFIDRGIIPGASNEFISFIKNDLHTSTPSLYLGLLQSSFIVGLAIGSAIFGHLVHLHGRFKLTGIGCTIWIVAVFLSGLSKFVDSYVCLVLARMLSGVGEASLQVTIPPWIQNIAPENEKGSWLAFFYTAVPVGTALGYAYSAFIAESIGWQWSFFIEGLLMFPFVVFMFSISPQFPCEKISYANMISPISCENDDIISTEESNEKEALIDARLGCVTSSSSDSKEENLSRAFSFSGTSASIEEDVDTYNRHNAKPTFRQEFGIVMSRPIFLCLVAGFAAQTANLIGLSTFGSAILMGLGYFNTESESSTCFGILICLSGIISTPLGGIALDRMIKAIRSNNNNDNKLDNFNSSSSSIVRRKHSSLSLSDKDNNLTIHNPLIENDHHNSSPPHDSVSYHPATHPATMISRPSNASSLFDHSRSNPNILKVVEQEEINSINNISSGDNYNNMNSNIHDNINNKMKMDKVLELVTISSLIAVVLMCSIYWLNNVYSFMALVSFGCGFLFFCTPGINMALMLSVPQENQSFALAMMVIFMHGLGDVPSPVLVGLLKDTLAPGCVGSEDDDGQDAATSDECRDDKAGLLLTILIVNLWLLWCVFFFGLAWYLNHYHRAYMDRCTYATEEGCCCRNMCGCGYCKNINHYKIKTKDENIVSTYNHRNTVHALMDSVDR